VYDSFSGGLLPADPDAEFLSTDHAGAKNLAVARIYIPGSGQLVACQLDPGYLDRRISGDSLGDFACMLCLFWNWKKDRKK